MFYNDHFALYYAKLLLNGCRSTRYSYYPIQGQRSVLNLGEAYSVFFFSSVKLRWSKFYWSIKSLLLTSVNQQNKRAENKYD
jgi:hypothetical protein